MSDATKLNEQKRSEKNLAGAKDKYNPVNMAGKTTEKNEKVSPDNPPGDDDYNPVNMAGKKADTRKNDSRQPPGKSSQKPG